MTAWTQLWEQKYAERWRNGGTDRAHTPLAKPRREAPRSTTASTRVILELERQINGCQLSRVTTEEKP